MVRRVSKQPGKRMFIASAYAQTASGLPASLSSLVQFAPLVLIVIVFYFLLIRPQQTQQKVLKAQLGALKRGDRIVTSGGILGTVKKVAEGATEIDVEIAPNVTVSVVRSTVSTVLTPPIPANDKT
jgi:preprotein translocase subunit YajC